jgi:hypothetical protein
METDGTNSLEAILHLNKELGEIVVTNKIPKKNGNMILANDPVVYERKNDIFKIGEL